MRGILPTCAKPGCAARPTVQEDIGPSLGRIGRTVPWVRYILCERHDREFFGKSGWLRDTQSDRIKAGLIPVADEEKA